MTRIAITGGPRTGKTTLADQLWNGVAIAAGVADPMQRGRGADLVRHTDDLMHLGWSEASQAATLWLDEPGPWIVEGVAVSRALRKWHDQHPGERPPVDRVIYLREPHDALSKGQAAMAKGVASVHAEIEGWLRQHGVITEYPSMTAHQLRAPSMGGKA